MRAVYKSSWTRVKTTLDYVVRKRRVAALLTGSARLDHAQVAFDRSCGNALCDAAINLNRHYLRHYRNTGWISRLKAPLQPTAAIIDLRRFATFEDYCGAVARHSNGNDVRMVKKARRLGFRTRTIADGSHDASRHAIIQSKVVRSHGVVSLAVSDKMAAEDVRLDDVAPTCSCHWILAKGVFGSDDAGSTMVAHASLVRSGNLVNIRHFMGHGDYLKKGVAKMLMFDIVAWLWEGADPHVKGVDYLLYGAIEHGNEGAFNWRRYMEFKPFLLDLPADRSGFLPKDFDPDAYRRLNPDLGGKLPPRRHYIYHGAFQQRPYRD